MMSSSEILMNAPSNPFDAYRKHQEQLDDERIAWNAVQRDAAIKPVDAPVVHDPGWEPIPVLGNVKMNHCGWRGMDCIPETKLRYDLDAKVGEPIWTSRSYIKVTIKSPAVDNDERDEFIAKRTIELIEEEFYTEDEAAVMAADEWYSSHQEETDEVEEAEPIKPVMKEEKVSLDDITFASEMTPGLVCRESSGVIRGTFDPKMNAGSTTSTYCNASSSREYHSVYITRKYNGILLDGKSPDHRLYR